MLINLLTNVNKWYLIVKCYQFIIQIDVFGTQNEKTDRHTHTIQLATWKSNWMTSDKNQNKGKSDQMLWIIILFTTKS